MIIYKITHKVSGKIYIGKTKRPLNRRIQQHLEIAARNPDTYFTRALAHYGIAAFLIEEIDFALSLIELNQKEKYWIKTLDCMAPKGYNLTAGGDGNSEGGRSIPKEKRRGWLGKKHSAQTIEKMRASARAREKRPRLGERNKSLDMRAKVSAGKKRQKRPDQAIRMSEMHRRNRALIANQSLALPLRPGEWIQ